MSNYREPEIDGVKMGIEASWARTTRGFELGRVTGLARKSDGTAMVRMTANVDEWTMRELVYPR